ncbi:IS200/IS605 family transposase (plasmid) [Acidiphilium multivorum]|uniref:IS200/IS605 family transposase n=1 Tax=Acidiphilium multivorum TaxID=62140 RepID=UPI001F4C45A1|nr:IS200/IS605 family transposase [Acidiphilium multivorum]UNC16291.1 IS200/IS605 family transposase [Acidiphilium multivorum]
MVYSNELNTGRHVVFLLHAHLVFSTKYRRGVLTDRVREFLRPAMAKICTDFEATLEAFDGEDDHVHLLVRYPPKVALSTLVNSLKGASSRLIRKEKFPEVTSRLWGGHFWSPSYCVVSCGGAPLEIIKQYVEQQRAPDRNRKKQARRLTPP